MDISDSKNGLL